MIRAVLVFALLAGCPRPRVHYPELAKFTAAERTTSVTMTAAATVMARAGLEVGGMNGGETGGVIVTVWEDEPAIARTQTRWVVRVSPLMIDHVCRRENNRERPADSIAAPVSDVWIGYEWRPCAEQPDGKRWTAFAHQLADKMEAEPVAPAATAME